MMEKSSSAQIEMVSLEDLVSSDHVYRQYHALLDIKRLTAPLVRLELPLGIVGYGIRTLFSCLLLQWIEDLSDRELEKYLEENTAGKYWYGYKKHASVDMQSGLINKVAITPANLTDAKGLKHVCPSRGVVFADKSYCTKDAQQTLQAKGCEDGSIKKNNMKGKNYDQDRWRSKIRAPYERVFSKTSHRVRYKGVQKNQFAGLLEAFAHNLKRLVKLDAPPIFALAMA